MNLMAEPNSLLLSTEKETGLKCIGSKVYPWNPQTGEVEKTPVP